ADRWLPVPGFRKEIPMTVTDDDLIWRPEIRNKLVQLYKDSYVDKPPYRPGAPVGTYCREQCGFIVRDTRTGKIDFLPSTFNAGNTSENSCRYETVFEQGGKWYVDSFPDKEVISIVHTHPATCSAAFTERDIDSARHLKVPSYILKGICNNDRNEGANGGVYKLILPAGVGNWEANNLARKVAGPEYWD
ncbi:MAG: hypothetical protein N3A38_14530, partial [Planctomycetota bacterium]|nr:hypothetical protein [Planctomycetota bacterium]